MKPKHAGSVGCSRFSACLASLLGGFVLAGIGAAVALGLSSPLRAQTTNKPASTGFVVRNFVFPEHYDVPAASQGRTNALKALVTGREAVPQGRDLYLVKSMRMEHFYRNGRTNLIATSPECIVDLTRREVSSPQRVEAEGNGGNLFIEGEGFSCQLTNFHLIISNKVRAVIRREPPRPENP